MHAGELQVTGAAQDTFLRVDTGGFRKGVAFVNGFNLGRYWSLGPQMTLYVPAPVLRADSTNVIWLFELEASVRSTYQVEFLDEPILDNDVPGPGAECTVPDKNHPELAQT